MKLAVLALCCTGCVVVARSERVKTLIRGGIENTPVDASFTLDVTSKDAEIQIHAFEARRCRRDHIAEHHIRHTKRLRLELRDDDNWGMRIFGILLAPVTLPVSAAIAAVKLAGHHDKVRTRVRRSLGRTETPCYQYVPRTIALHLPSGARQTLVTDHHGVLTVSVPPSEPDTGEILIATRGMKQTLTYYRTYALCAADRVARLETALLTRINRRPLFQRIPRCGSITTGADPDRERVWQIGFAAIDHASRGDCQSALNASARIVQHDPALHALVVKDAMACVARTRAP